MDQSEISLGRVYRHQRKNPSFSSSLLDEIYRSIDEGNNREDEEMVFYRETMKTKQSNSTTTHVNQRKEEDEEMVSSVRRRACLVDKWMEKKTSEKVVVRRQSVPNLHTNRSSMVFNSSSSSSDSCCGGGFSSSEAESVYGTRSTTTTSSYSSSSSSSSRPKPVRTNVSVEEKKNSVSVSSSQQEKSNHFNGFIKTKSRALKIYGDLKKVKQPISPGGRLATFINSLFNAGTPKKPKISTTTTTTTTSVQDCSTTFDRKSTQTSTCSSVSSFSRSCLSKTPTSSRTKRSVRFYPVSVIVDEDCRPCGHKCLYEEEPGLMAVTKVRKIEESAVPMILNEELKFHIMEKNRRVEEAARNLLLRNGYQKKNSNFDIRDLMNYEDEEEEEEEDEDDDDAASCSSSDLFELDNLERYREELPVYETTHLGRNRAIANGLIM